MTTTDPNDTARAARGSTTAGAALRGVLEASLHVLNERLARRTERWAGDLENGEATGGSAQQAGYEGAKAGLQGRSPTWAAIKGAWAGAGGSQKFAAVVIIVLFILLAPVPALVLLLGVLVTLLVKAIQAANR